MGYDYGYGGYWKPHVSVYERERDAEKEVEKLRKKGQQVSPVVIEGNAIAKTFWGKSWCTNLEQYSDYANRIPRGRSYVRHGAVVDLQLEPGVVTALVSGSRLYKVKVEVAPIAKAQWAAVCRDCTGGIDSLVELLQGRFSNAVMTRVCQPGTGLFPSPKEIVFSCSCPDWASMCKHVAAVLYGVGARLDHQPELLFRLRKVDEADLIAHAGKDAPLSAKGPAADRVLGGDEVADLFGLEMAQAAEAEAPAVVPTPRRGRPARPAQSPTVGSAPAEELTPEIRAQVALEVRAALKPFTDVLDRMQALVVPEAGVRAAVRDVGPFAVGQRVTYRQGRGVFEATVVGPGASRGVVQLERLKDGKRIELPASKVAR